MSNGFATLGSIRYTQPGVDVDDCREYWLGSCWTSSENFVEIKGLEADRPAGPVGQY
jgi:hypothetical protein